MYFRSKMPRHKKLCFELFKIKQADFVTQKLIFFILLVSILTENKH